jgi:hypothetical protein
MIANMKPTTPPPHQPYYQDLANMLHAIKAPTGLRDKPSAGDLPGAFDFWFDGGAGKHQTGLSEYAFATGARARSILCGPPLCFSVDVEFPNGWTVRVQHN